MFDWFWGFLFMLSKTLFRLIDGLILCANKLCGIETINFNGEETDFMSYLLFSGEVGFAFRVAAILATMLLVIFTVFIIVRSIAKDKSEGTPTQIAIKTFKTLIMFFLVPLVIIAFMSIGNSFVQALYQATVQSAASPGTFLFSAFASDGGMNPESVELFKTGELDYYITENVEAHMALEDFPFLFSWLAGGVVLFAIGSAMLIFVDRVISLVILYIAAPISISTSVIDDGARFKLWRDQFLSKFVMGYGMILAINIYAMVCGLVMKPGFSFFPDNAFLDLIMKLLIIGGGALTMQKAMALIGNLVSQGAGSNELRDNALSAGSLARLASGGAGMALGAIGTLTGAKAAKSIVSDAMSMKSRDMASGLLNRLGLGGGESKNDKNGDSSGKDSQNKDQAKYGSNANAAKDAITKGDSVASAANNKDDSNSNNNTPTQKGSEMVGDAITKSDERAAKPHATAGEETNGQ